MKADKLHLIPAKFSLIGFQKNAKQALFNSNDTTKKYTVTRVYFLEKSTSTRKVFSEKS